MKKVHFISHLAAPRKDTQDPTKTDGLFSVDPNEVESLLVLNKNHTFCEFMSLGAITKVFLDKDVYVELEEGQTVPTEDVIRKYHSDVEDHVQFMVEMLESDRVNIDYVIATRHGPTSNTKQYKLSFRPFLLGCEIKYTYILALIQAAQQEEYWDTTVYKASEQLLAAIHGCKGRTKGYFDARVLEMEKGHDRDRTLDYVAQYTDPSWPLLDLSEEFVKEQRDAAEARKLSKGRTSTTKTCLETDTDHLRKYRQDEKDTLDPQFVRDLLTCLSADTAADRTTWLKVAFGLKAAYGMETQAAGAEKGEEMDEKEKEYFDAWLAFSMKASAKFQGGDDCRKTWDSIKTRDAVEGGIQIGTLCFYAARDAPAIYKKLQKKHQQRLQEKGATNSNSAGGVLQRTTASATRQNEAGINKNALLHALRTCNLQLNGLPDSTKISQEDEGTTITFDGGQDDLRGTIQGKSGFTVHKTDGSFLGTICKDVVVTGSLGFVHNRIPEQATFFYNRPTEMQAVLVAHENGNEGEVRLLLNNMLANNAFLSFQGLRVCAKSKVDAVQKGLMDALNTHVHTNFNLVQNILNNNGTINVSLAHSDTTSAFPIIRTKLLDYASERRMTKRDGIVYEPVPDCPCAYREAFTYADYVNKVLRGDPIYTSNPKRFDEAIKYLTNYQDDEMPKYVPDRDLMSFSNGVLELATGTFTEYAAMDPDSPMALRVARHHIHQQYTGSTDTPLLDKVLGAQFEPEVAQLLCALFGRALFKIGELDGWQVMPYLVGIGGTGKSLLLNVLQHMFAPGAVGNLAAKREDVFGMANLVDKEIVMGRDMPAKLSGSLPQEIMQAMTAGEGMEVPRKGQVALNVTWVAPVVLASNHLPDYVNTGNNVGRRLVTLRFNTVVKDPEEDLQKSILESELPNIVCRCLRAYADMRERVRAARGFWKAVPAVVLEWQSKLAAATNKLHEFLAMEDDERGYTIERVEGGVTWFLDFKAAFEARMGVGFAPDPATFHSFGFRMSEKVENACMACKKVAKLGCCSLYSKENRRKKLIIFDMCLVAIEKGSNSERRFREAIEEETGLSFPSVRPSWLSNITGRAMELDMYNEKTHIAVEYDGPQHTEFPNPYHHSRAEFEDQTARDRLKDRLCADRGVELIRIRSGPISKELASFRKAYEEISRKRNASM